MDSVQASFGAGDRRRRRNIKMAAVRLFERLLCDPSAACGMRENMATTCESVCGTNSITSLRPMLAKNSAVMANGTWLESVRW